MESRTLTPKQQKILEFIQTFSLQKGYGPSQKEIAQHFGFSSLGTIQNYLVRLEKYGFLKRDWNAKRALKLTQTKHHHDHANVSILPLLGRVAAGSPIEAIENRQTIDIPTSMIRNGAEYFALKVKGDSMIDEGIFEDDIVIVRKSSKAENGEIVVALIDNEATIKRLKMRGASMELLPANPKYKPIQIREDQDFSIQGIFAGLIRKA